MPLIKANSGIVTQINVFTVPQGGQQPLINLLAEAAKFASSIPGWLSASLHRSHDGTRVENYAQSESPEKAKMIIDRLRTAGYLDRNRVLGKAHPASMKLCSLSNGNVALSQGVGADAIRTPTPDHLTLIFESVAATSC